MSAPHSTCFSMPSIQDLPTELLIDIFEKSSWGIPFAPLTLSSVCRSWHGVVYTSPRVWQLISLQGVHKDEDATVYKLQRQTNLWLTNSSPLPFDVTLDLRFCFQEQFLAIISILIGGLYRWRSCTFIVGRFKETTDVAGIVLAASARPDHTHSDSSDEESDSDSEGEGRRERPRLCMGATAVDHLEVIVDEAVLLSRIGGYPDVEDVDLEGKLPTLRPILNGSIALKCPLPSLPPPNQINTMGITVLTITESGQLPTNPVQLLRFLTAFPEIETLTFEGRMLQPGYDANVPVVTLPKLHELVIGNTISTRIILSHLDLPKLTSLSLQRLNTDVLVPNNPTGEDGESDDEAHDYSQSPHSDYATGMGLRTLQKRSHPPLRVLDMHYSDLRTKDFLFCFDHFSLLSEFRIVASDMSEKVIEMLAPYDDPSGRRGIRLPQLKRLELSRCQRVPGLAVVNALRERVSFVDQSPTYPQMDRISVIDCAEVLHQHNLTLSAILGSRFHFSGRLPTPAICELRGPNIHPRLITLLAFIPLQSV